MDSSVELKFPVIPTARVPVEFIDLSGWTKDDLLALITTQEAELVLLRSFKHQTEVDQHQKSQLIAKRNQSFEMKDTLIEDQKKLIESLGNLIESQRKGIEIKEKLIEAQKEMIEAQREMIESKNAWIEKKDQLIDDQKKLIEKFENLKNIFECGICKNMPDQAVSGECSHTFCRSCIQEWLDQGEYCCPICRKTVYSLKSNLMVNEAVEYMVKKIGWTTRNDLLTEE